MALILINGAETPAPVKYQVNRADIDSANSGRNDNGVMTREIVRRNVTNIAVEWQMLSNDEADTLCNMVSDSMRVSYYWGGMMHSAIMYASDRSSEMIAIPNGDAFWNVSFNLIEY